MKYEIVILGGRKIDQKLRVWQVGAQASIFGFYKLIECIIKKIYHDVKQNAKICAIGETECEVFIVGGQRIDQKRKKGWWRGSRIEREETKRNWVNNFKRRIGTSTLASACCSASSRHYISPEFPTRFCSKALQQWSTRKMVPIC